MVRVAQTPEEAEQLARHAGLPVRMRLCCDGKMPPACREQFEHVPSGRAVRAAFTVLVCQLEQAGGGTQFAGVMIESMHGS